MSLTTQSLSVPVVEAKSLAVRRPVIVTSSASGSVSQLRTSGRRWAKRWSPTSQVPQPEPRGS